MELARKTKAILVDLIHPRMQGSESLERLAELEELVRTYGGIVIVKTYQKRFAPHPRTFLGPGKITALGEEGKRLGAELLLINDQLKPRQIYNVGDLLKGTGLQVWDRIDLILKIFAKHARTTEARLEIELASLRHMGPRIFGMGMELSRQAGGIGTVGIGETNIEIMRRHLKERERRLIEKLKQYQTVRAGHRKARQRKDLPTLAIVGYTNAGKTTLLNSLTGRKEFASNILFATLDTRVGHLYLPGKQKIALVSDTIGFIKRLPPELLNAFSSTLSEAVEAEVLLHVVDGGEAIMQQKVRVVEEILGRLGIEGKPRVLVMNKIDQLGPEELKNRVGELLETGLPCVPVSAAKGEGIPELISAIERRL